MDSQVSARSGLPRHAQLEQEAQAHRRLATAGPLHSDVLGGSRRSEAQGRHRPVEHGALRRPGAGRHRGHTIPGPESHQLGGGKIELVYERYEV